jgi:hypothetical protein
MDIHSHTSQNTYLHWNWTEVRNNNTGAQKSSRPEKTIKTMKPSNSHRQFELWINNGTIPE